MGGRDPREAKLPFLCLALSCSPFQWKIEEMRTIIFLCPPLFPWSPCSEASTRRVTFRAPLHFRARRLSRRPKPGQSAGEPHSTPCSCCAVGLGSGHWERTRKYQWALLG